MQVKVFESSDMASGLKKVKSELGPDALILSTRTIRNGKLGLLGKPTLEITAAIDSDNPAEFDQKKFSADTPPAFTLNPTSRISHVVGESLDHLLHTDSAVPNKTSDSSNTPIRNDVKELKNLVRDLSGKIALLQNTKALNCSGFSSASQSNKNLNADEPILSSLLARGINLKTSKLVCELLQKQLTDQEINQPNKVSQKVIEVINTLLEISSPSFKSGQKQQRIALVGPTGVGKTTTLAKIAASYLAANSGSIALITIDTYRIAAIEQLKVYGEIMHIPVDVVITPDQLWQAITRHRDKDLILIDTAGRSPKDQFCIEELSTFLRPELDIDKHLVLSATTREEELLHTLKQFEQLGSKNTIFTKIDECINLGVLLNIQIQNSSPLSFITNGQRVPEDIIELSQNVVANLIMSTPQGSLND